MSRKGNLSAALSQFDKRPAALKEQETALPASREAAAPPKKKVVKTESAHQGRAALPPSRQGKKALTGYFDPDVLRQLKVMAAAEDTTIQALMIEALNDLFKKYGKPHIA
jgi:Antitoxin-like ribbon-helix-helix